MQNILCTTQSLVMFLAIIIVAGYVNRGSFGTHLHASYGSSSINNRLCCLTGFYIQWYWK